VIDGNLEVGFFSVLVFMTQRLLWPLTTLGETFDLYRRAMASTRRILDLLAVRPQVVEGAGRLPRAPAGAVRFEDVRFAYTSGPEVLRGLDLDLPAGETHAVVGLTGGGKSTVVKLLLRLCDATGGRVTVDGIDVRELSFTELRGVIGLVSQDVFLFDGTVRENIAYGDPGAPAERIEEAARLAEAHDFIAALSDGYDTIVGERGQKLSGGQRQRLSIARAIVRDPAILVLDEATSAVDNETEAAIQRSLEHVARDRTTLVIAHRLSTVRAAHRIHVLEDGAVTESGTHDELVAMGGLVSWRIVVTNRGARRVRSSRDAPSVRPGADLARWPGRTGAGSVTLAHRARRPPRRRAAHEGGRPDERKRDSRPEPRARARHQRLPRGLTQLAPLRHDRRVRAGRASGVGARDRRPAGSRGVRLLGSERGAPRPGNITPWTSSAGIDARRAFVSR
jgi:ABC-type multidrug transport system ATPase subunit